MRSACHTTTFPMRYCNLATQQQIRNVESAGG
jgi:hypothetical protein